jgi:fumarate hydratase class II
MKGLQILWQQQFLQVGNQAQEIVMGKETVGSENLWGQITQRNVENFTTGNLMPLEVIYTLAHVKKAAAVANQEVGVLDEEKSVAIQRSADLILSGKFDDQFPLRVWQTGSGTATNMNVNEVIANLAQKTLGVNLHPNNHVNLAQSTNDIFSSALNIIPHILYNQTLEPQLKRLIQTLNELVTKYKDVVKVGRTHYQEAVPLSFGQELGAFEKAFEITKSHIETALDQMRALGIGGTAVGTGVNAHPDFASIVCKQLSAYYSTEFYPDENPFYQISNKTAVGYYHSALKELSLTLNKLGNDLRLLSMGPRSGIRELILPANEPGSSIMPGKVNPTQIEALLQVCAAVIGNDMTVSIAISNGSLQLNTYMPLLATKLVESTQLLGQVLENFIDNCLSGITVDKEQIQHNLENNLMLVTYLTSEIGYDLATEVTKLALKEDISIHDALKKVCPNTKFSYPLP